MAAGDSLKLQVLLSAIDRVTGPMNKILGGTSKASRALRAAQGELKKLDAAQRDIDGFRKLQTQLGRTSSELTQAQRKMARLTAEVVDAQSPSRKMMTALRRQGAAVRELGDKHSRLRGRLDDARKALDAAGFSTSRLAVHERKLAGDIQSANRALAEQKTRLNKLHAARQRMSKMHGAGMTAGAHGAGALVAGATMLRGGASVIGRGMDFESQLRGMTITAGFSRAQEAALGDTIRADAKKWGQFTDVIAEGLGVLVANGITATSDLQYYSGLLAKTSVATGATMQQLGATTVALQQNLGIGKNGLKGALDSLAYSGKQGSFELKDMAKWLPQLTPQMAALGVSGRAAVDQLGAALQVARLGAGDADSAANNLKNYLAKIVSPETVSHFDKAGIDIQHRLMEMSAKGIGPLRGSLQLITEYMGSKGPAAAAQFQAALKLSSDQQRQVALQRLAEAYALGDLFRDQQAMAFIRPALANADKMQSIAAGASVAAGGIDADWLSRMDTGRKQLDQLKIGLSELALIATAALGPAVNDLLNSMTRFANKVGQWAKDNPRLAAGLLKVAAGLAIVLTVGGALLVALAPLLMMFGGIQYATAMLSGGGGLAGLSTALRTLARGVIPVVLNAGRALLVLLGGISWPILAIAAVIAVLAAVVWKYWGPIKAFMIGLWEGVVEAMAPMAAALAPLKPAWDAFAGAVGKVWGWIKKLFTPFQATSEQLDNATNYGRTFGRILGTVVVTPVRLLISAVGQLWKALKFAFNWSPLVLIIKNWEAILDFFSNLRDKFKDIGGNIMSGLVDGIVGGLKKVHDTIVGVGNKVIKFFGGTLEVKSPSRVFARLGDHTMAGFANGLDRSARLPLRALGDTSRRMRQLGAGVAIAAAASPAVAIDNRPPLTGGGAALAGNVAYNITINAQAGAGAQDIAAAVRAELERIERERAAHTRSRLGDYD